MSDAPAGPQGPGGPRNRQAEAVEAAKLARQRVREALDEPPPVLGERIRLSAQEARVRAARMRAEGRGTPARLVEEAAVRGQRVGDWLTGLEAKRMAEVPAALVRARRARS